KDRTAPVALPDRRGDLRAADHVHARRPAAGPHPIGHDADRLRAAAGASGESATRTITMNRVLAALVISFLPAAALASEPSPSLYSRTYGATEGLFASTIHAIAQDGEGYLWLGADTGLIRFDGFVFGAWGTRGEPPLPGRIVLALAAARDGSLWVGF